MTKESYELHQQMDFICLDIGLKLQFIIFLKERQMEDGQNWYLTKSAKNGVDAPVIQVISPVHHLTVIFFTNGMMSP